MNASRAASIVWKDFCLLLVLGFVSMVIMLLPFVNDPGKEADPGDVPPGNVLVAIYWPEGRIDVDLWLTGPGQDKPTGYSNKNGTLFNLLRDDLGGPDIERNYENAYSRGTPSGEYVINAHLYSGPAPVEVEVEVSINDGKPGKASLRKLVKTKLTLTHKGNERTAIRFRLDGNAQIEPGSMNSVQRPLRAASSGNASPDYGN